MTDVPAGDQLPDDLQPHLVDPEEYVFPNNNRRRVPGYLYLGIAALLTILVVVNGEGVFVNKGFLAAALILVVMGIYSIVTGWNLNVDEREALVAAIGQVGFPVGHASAQMGWRGILSRPTWRILLYSADDPPTRRGFVLVDGVEPTVVDFFVEENPEDWTELLAAAGPGTASLESKPAAADRPDPVDDPPAPVDDPAAPIDDPVAPAEESGTPG